MERVDLLVAGAGAAGIPAAVFAAAEEGARVMLAEAAPCVGGTFHLSSGQMSAAGTRVQAALGIVDSPDAHYDDVMRICRGTANPALVRLAVDHAADTLHWLLDNGLELLPDHPLVHYGHEPYRTARTCWGPEEGRSVLKVLEPLLRRAVEAGAIDLRLETRLRALRPSPGGRLVASLETAAGELEIAADEVILTTGGYTANPALFSELSLGRPLHGGGYAYGRGDGLSAARELGAGLTGTQAYLPTFAAVEELGAPGGMTFATHTYPHLRQPWELYVDGSGRRFVREDEPSPDARERALLKLPDLRFWALFDARIQREAPNFFTLAEWPEVEPRFGSWPGYERASSLGELAGRIGADPGELAATVATYNEAIERGAPDPMGRLHRPLPIAEPPFYAVRHFGWSIVGFAGLAVDADLRVIDAQGVAIPGLHAAGEVLGLAATSGGAFAGGMSVTPAMTFGRLLGQRLGAAAKARRAA